MRMPTTPQLFLDDSSESKTAMGLVKGNGHGKKVQIFWKGKDFNDCDFALPALFSISGVFRGVDQIGIFLSSRLD